jgi:hypothetical protein
MVPLPFHDKWDEFEYFWEKLRKSEQLVPHCWKALTNAVEYRKERFPCIPSIECCGSPKLVLL